MCARWRRRWLEIDGELLEERGDREIERERTRNNYNIEIKQRNIVTFT